MNYNKKLKKASELLDQASKNFTKNHFSKIEKARKIINGIIEEDNYVRKRHKN